MKERLSRRDFLLAAGRWLLAAALGAGAVRLLLGRPRLLRQTCVNQGVCRGCPAFSGCGLPPALSARQRAPWARRRS